MRKTYHLLFAALTAALFLLHVRSGVVWSAPFIALMFLAATLLLADTVFRLKVRGRLFAGIFKGSEERKMSGITYGVWGVICAYLIGGSSVAAISAMLLGVTDGIPGFAGVYLGRYQLPYNRRKTVEGTISGLVVGLAVMLLWPGSRSLNLALAVVASIAESLPFPFDDNFVVPVVTAVIAVGYKAIVGP